MHQDDLHAFADGRLPAERISAIKAWLAQDPAAREQVASWHRQNELIGRLYGKNGPDLLPVRLRPEFMRRGRRRMLKRMAAGVAAGLLVGGGIGWVARGIGSESLGGPLSLAQQAAKLHRSTPSAFSFTVEAGDEAELSNWLRQQAGHAVPVPDLTDAGLRILGGNVLTDASEVKAAQLIYEDPEQSWVTLYVTWGKVPEPAEFRFFQTEDLNGFYWPQGEYRCVLTAEVDPDYLLSIARLAYDQMELAEATSRLLVDR
jgi:anti-sigma factor RsiW